MHVSRTACQYSAAAYVEAEWKLVVLRVMSYCLECHCQVTNKILWRIEFRHLLRPAVRLLLSSERTQDPPGAFAFHTRISKTPFICAAKDRDVILNAVQKTALERLGLIIDSRSHFLIRPERVYFSRWSWKYRSAGAATSLCRD